MKNLILSENIFATDRISPPSRECRRMNNNRTSIMSWARSAWAKTKNYQQFGERNVILYTYLIKMSVQQQSSNINYYNKWWVFNKQTPTKRNEKQKQEKATNKNQTENSLYEIFYRKLMDGCCTSNARFTFCSSSHPHSLSPFQVYWLFLFCTRLISEACTPATHLYVWL